MVGKIVMKDSLEMFEQYKGFKEIVDLIYDISKLREYYYAGQYDMME